MAGDKGGNWTRWLCRASWRPRNYWSSRRYVPPGQLNPPLLIELAEEHDPLGGAAGVPEPVPKELGLVIPARFCWLERLSWSGPPSAMSFLMAGAQRGDRPVGVLPLRPVLQLVRGLDPGAGDNAPVAAHDHLAQAELVPHHRHDLGKGRPSSHELDRSNSVIGDGFGSGARYRAASFASITSCQPATQSIAA